MKDENEMQAYLSVQLPRSVVIADVVGEVSATAVETGEQLRLEEFLPLYPTELLVALLCEFGLHANHGFKTWIEVRNPKIKQLW